MILNIEPKIESTQSIDVHISIEKSAPRERSCSVASLNVTQSKLCLVCNFLCVFKETTFMYAIVLKNTTTTNNNNNRFDFSSNTKGQNP